MKQLVFSLTTALAVSCILAMTAFAGPESLPSDKEMKEVAPIPAPECNWAGFYLGLNAGGEFGHSEIDDPVGGHRFGFSESGFSGGGQFGYNWQWRRLVLGPEFEVGYMDLSGRGDEPGFDGFVFGETTSSFYTTLRGRVGVALDWHGCWLIYGTGGALGVDYTTRFHVDAVPAPAVRSAWDPTFFDARSTDFDWGYTVGGGIERQI